VKGERCSRLWEVDPYREGRLGARDAQSFQRHLSACEVCRTQLEHDERLRTLAQALPEDAPSELSLRRLRGRVLRDIAMGIAPPTSSRALRLVLAMLALAGLATGGWALVAHRPPPAIAIQVPETATPPTTPSALEPAEAFAGAVVASTGARWSQTRVHGVERVVLDDGALRMHVRSQVVGERFLVMLPDGELEVRGTTFEVSVEHGATTRVHVEEGEVEVRLEGQETRRLAMGETWRITAPLAASALSNRTRSAPAASTAVVDGAAAYAAAIGLLREGRNDEAAAAFHALVQSQPSASQAEDASFLDAVALARAGRGNAAALAADDHLARFPGSFHRREATILVARAAGQRGDCAKVRTLLAPWMGHGSDPDVQGTLDACRGR
jgi:hypothetical protein